MKIGDFMKIIYEHDKHVIFTECDGIEWLDGFVTFKDKVTGGKIRLYYGDLSELEANINLHNTLDFRNREIKEEKEHSEDSLKPTTNVIVVSKEDDKTADSSLRDFWSNEATLIQKGLIYAISPSVYRAITADNDYIRSDIAEEILHKVKHYVFDPSDYDFAGLYAVAPWRIDNVLRDKYMYFWDLCATGNNELIRKTYGTEEILEMLKTAEKESIC